MKLIIYLAILALYIFFCTRNTIQIIKYRDLLIDVGISKVQISVSILALWLYVLMAILIVLPFSELRYLFNPLPLVIVFAVPGFVVFKNLLAKLDMVSRSKTASILSYIENSFTLSYVLVLIVVVNWMIFWTANSITSIGYS